MITIAKLHSLADRTRWRKCARILHEAALDAQAGIEPDRTYLLSVAGLLANDTGEILNEAIRTACGRFLVEAMHSDLPRLVWACDDIAHVLLTCLGTDQADWDFADRGTGRLDGSRRVVQPFTVVVDRIRSPFNTGALFRTADSFGVDRLLLVEPTASPLHPRAMRTARGCVDTVHWEELGVEAVIASIKDKPVFALELGGTDIDSFSFPLDGVAIVGSEELGVSPELLAVADASLGRVSIPLAGTKGSLNVSVAFGILMHTWFSHVMRCK